MPDDNEARIILVITHDVLDRMPRHRGHACDI